MKMAFLDGRRLRSACQQAAERKSSVRYTVETEDGYFIITVKPRAVHEAQALAVANHLSGMGAGAVSQSS